MKNIYHLLLAIFLLSGNIINAKTGSGKTSLSGKVTDKETGTTLPGVVIYIPDLKTGAVTTIDGTYKIGNLPQTKVLVQVSFLGYKTIIETLDLSQIKTRDFVMEVSAKEMHEVVVTGTSKATEIRLSPV